VVGVGGGGIPVVTDESGDLHGVEAVIDKDLGCSLLARELHADLLLITTAVEKVSLFFGTPQERHLDHLNLEEAKYYLAGGVHFAKGSMAPKIEAVIEYLESGGKEALITDPSNVERGLAGKTGTRFTVS
jgi:carbamate kinase